MTGKTKRILPRLLQEPRGSIRGFGGIKQPLKPSPARWNIGAVGELVAGQAPEQIQTGHLKQAKLNWQKSLVDKKELQITARKRFLGRLRSLLGARDSDMIEFYKFLGTHYLFVYPTMHISETKIALHRNLGVVIRITNSEIIEALDYLG